MTITNYAKAYARPDRPRPAGPHLAFLAALLAAGAAALAAAQTLHWDYVLPLTSTALFVLAGALAAAGWRRRTAPPGGAVTYWHVAGALTLIGICAAALIEPEQMVRVLHGRQS